MSSYEKSTFPAWKSTIATALPSNDVERGPGVTSESNNFHVFLLLSCDVNLKKSASSDAIPLSILIKNRQNRHSWIFWACDRGSPTGGPLSLTCFCHFLTKSSYVDKKLASLHSLLRDALRKHFGRKLPPKSGFWNLKNSQKKYKKISKKKL